MPRATCEQATSKTCALHVKIMDVPGDSVELILVGQQEQGRRRRVWRDGGLPRELGRVPLRAARRTKAIESDTPAARAFQRLMFERFLGAPNKSEDDPAFYVFKGAVELAIGTHVQLPLGLAGLARSPAFWVHTVTDDTIDLLC